MTLQSLCAAVHDFTFSVYSSSWLYNLCVQQFITLQFLCAAVHYFTISVCSSLCNSLFFNLILSFYSLAFHFAFGVPINTIDGECEGVRKRPKKIKLNKLLYTAMVKSGTITEESPLIFVQKGCSLVFLSARSVSAVSPDWEMKKHTSSRNIGVFLKTKNQW